MTRTDVIREQQRYVRERFTDAPVAELTLIPRVTRNPLGRRPISLSTLTDVHRRWVDALPALQGSDGLEFDRSAVFLYAYRHSYAQRHADAGTPVDVLRELMGHRSMTTTQGYYKNSRELRQTGEEPQVACSLAGCSASAGGSDPAV
jgi:integrase